MVEQVAVNHQVVGSSPTSTAKLVIRAKGGYDGIFSSQEQWEERFLTPLV